MPNNVLNTSLIASTAVRLLENELVMGRRVFRGYEDEFDKKVNGYKTGDTISIRKPQQFTVRQTAVATLQDVNEGKLTLQVNLQKGVDFSFSSAELTLKIDELGERVIRPAMIRLANQIDVDVMNLFTQIPNWVNQPATGADAKIDSFAKFAAGAERLDQNSAPQDMRSAVLSPESYWALVGSQTNLFLPAIGGQAYRQGEAGSVGGIATYMSQNVPTLINGTNADESPTVTGAQSTTWDAVKNSEATPGTMQLVTGGWTAGSVVKAGTVFIIGSGATAVLAVNQVSKQVLPYQQHFTVMNDVTATGGAATLTITPPIIPTSVDAAWGTVDKAAGAAAVLSIAGAANGTYRQNLMFHRDAFALVIVPLVKPPGAVEVARESYKGCSARLIPYYNGQTDVSAYRLDVLYGVKVVDNRLAVRMGGGSATLGNPAT